MENARRKRIRAFELRSLARRLRERAKSSLIGTGKREKGEGPESRKLIVIMVKWRFSLGLRGEAEVHRPAETKRFDWAR